jgi:hypothetical protein
VPTSDSRWQSNDVNNYIIDIKSEKNKVTLSIFDSESGVISLYKELKSFKMLLDSLDYLKF